MIILRLKLINPMGYQWDFALPIDFSNFTHGSEIDMEICWRKIEIIIKFSKSHFYESLVIE